MKELTNSLKNQGVTKPRSAVYVVNRKTAETLFALSRFYLEGQNCLLTPNEMEAHKNIEFLKFEQYARKRGIFFSQE